MSSLHSNALGSQSQSNRASLGYGGVGDLHHGCVDDKSTTTINMDQTLLGMFPEPCLIHEQLKPKELY